MSAWDGQWYWFIAQNGYPTTLPLTPSGSVDTNQWAFLPVYPYLAKALTFGIGDWRIPALAVSVAAGFGAAVLLGALLLPHIGRGRALFAVALMSVSPLAFMFQTTYAESLGLLLLLGVLVLVDRGRYLAAIPVAIVLAFTRPGILAVALAVGLLLVVRYVRARRGGPALPRAELLARDPARRGLRARGLRMERDRGARDRAVGRVLRDARAPGGRSGCPIRRSRCSTPWVFAANFWATQVVGGGPAAWVGPVFLLALVLAFAAFLLSPWTRRLGATSRLWAASYALYLLAVFFPQSSVFRLLMPMAPLAGAHHAEVLAGPDRGARGGRGAPGALVMGLLRACSGLLDRALIRRFRDRGFGVAVRGGILVTDFTNERCLAWRR